MSQWERHIGSSELDTEFFLDEADVTTLLLQESESDEIGFRPPRLFLDHAPKGFRPERLARLMKGDGHAAAVVVAVELVAAGLAGKKKPVTGKGTDEFSGGERAQE